MITESNFGGNLLINVLKDLSHHFVELDPGKELILNQLFELEDDYLKLNKSDFVFGIYQLKS